jgi:hypothetical protein
MISRETPTPKLERAAQPETRNHTRTSEQEHSPRTPAAHKPKPTLFQRTLRRPIDPFKQASKLLTTLRMNPLDVVHSTQKMSTKIRVLKTILTLRPIFHAVEQRSFKLVKSFPGNVRTVIHDHPGHTLATPTSHHASLPRLDLKSFVESNRASLNVEPGNLPRKFGIAREREVIRVTRVVRSSRFGESRQPSIEPKRT